MSTIGVDAQITEDNKLEIEVNGKSSQVAIPTQAPSISIAKLLSGTNENVLILMNDISANVGHFIYFGYRYGTDNDSSIFTGLITETNLIEGIGILVQQNAVPLAFKGILFSRSSGADFTLQLIPPTSGGDISPAIQNTGNVKNFYYIIL